jgi:EpsI family protein
MKLVRNSLVLLVLMCAAAVSAVVLRPTHKVADLQPAIDLGAMIPRHFGDWREEPQHLGSVVNPQQQAAIDKLYNQTLSRTYVNPQGYRIMLSIAYGGDQSDSMQVHTPEVCYPAQGFQMLKKTPATIQTSFGLLDVTRVDTQLGARREPITYWTTLGDQVVRGGIHKKLMEMSYGLSGRIPDGLLFRISSIDVDIAHAYAAHAKFADQLLASVTPMQRKRLAGSFVP